VRVDIHNHFIPPYIVHQARRGRAVDGLTIERHDGQEWVLHRQGYRYPLAPEFWDPAAKLQHMDRLGIDISILSIAPTMLFHWLESGPAQEFCRQTNEAMAELAAQSGGRLYGLATVPCQDPAAAATEMRRAVQDLGLLGALIGTTIEKVPLDDPRFEPLLATVAGLGVPLFLHPYDKLVRMRAELADFYMSNLIGIPLATTLAASRLILSGCLDRHPNLSVVLMHAGGFMPYQIGRLDHGYRVRPETGANISSPPSSYIRRFYFDTITHAGDRLKSLLGWVGADRVVLGTDIPFDMADLNFAQHLAAADLDDKTVKMISSDNARRILKIKDD
jgi:aminocarboxymuconate-semialdehyde decarboxylase